MLRLLASLLLFASLSEGAKDVMDVEAAAWASSVSVIFLECSKSRSLFLSLLIIISAFITLCCIRQPGLQAELINR